MAVKGTKTILSYGSMPTPSGSTWTDIASILDIKPGKVEAEDIDTSTMDSDQEFNEYDPGWANAGEITCKIQFDKTQNAAIYALFRQKVGLKITFSEGSTWTASGYLKTFENESERLKVVTADTTWKLSGVPVFTPAA